MKPVSRRTLDWIYSVNSQEGWSCPFAMEMETQQTADT
ncbi:SMIM27 isoform 4 [Pongo abelii]|uniref:SMIM27 isoform 4 n=1 Tax=Pongo abelii TaxID=9601 RepID=A0A2J8XIL3_PONAB|nr:SMIM27 isoform 4 [Pongo abelii]